MPMLGLTMEEGTVAEWLKHEGEAVRKDEPLLTVEMDKGTVEVPAPVSGVLARILIQPGTTVAVRTPIAEIESSSASPTAAAAPVLSSPAGAAPPPARPEPVEAPAGRRSQAFSSPRARMRARELGVDVAQLRGTGPHGRIIEADVLAFSQTPERVLATPVARRLAQEHGIEIATLQGTGPGGRVTQEDVLRATTPRDVEPLSRIHRITAERMAASAQATARVTLFLEADFSEATRFRHQLQPEFARLGVDKLPWDAVIARAVA